MDLHLSVDDPTPARVCHVSWCSFPVCVTCGHHLIGEPGPECQDCAEGPYEVVPGPVEVREPGVFCG